MKRNADDYSTVNVDSQATKYIAHSEKLLKMAVFHYGEKVALQYCCQKRCFYLPDDQTKAHATADLAREQAASIAVQFLKTYKNSAIEKKLMKQGEKLKNIFRIPTPEQIVPRASASLSPPSKTDATMVSRKEAVVPSSTSQMTSKDPASKGSYILEMEGNPVDILQKIACESLPPQKVLFQVFEAGPGFKVDCKVGNVSFQAFSQTRKTAKKLAALKAIEHVRPGTKVLEPTLSSSGASTSVDMNLVHNFCQKNPYAAEFSFSSADGNFICNLKVISEETKRTVVNMTSREYSTKKEAKKEASSLAVIELRKKGFL